jgi:hypothetical protein
MPLGVCLYNRSEVAVKFQIVTYNQAQRLCCYPSTSKKRYLAMTVPLEILGEPFRAEGATREEAQANLIVLVQRFLDDYPELEVTEVDLQPSHV